MTPSRRRLLIGAAGFTAIAASWQRLGRGKVNFAFEPIPGLPGWRRTVSGGLSTIGGDATAAVFLGIGEKAPDPLPVTRLCDTLYRTARTGVPVAVFTDFFCPNCRVLEATIASRTDLDITWHELPLLGPYSKTVARAMIAAAFQGKRDALRTALLKSQFRPGSQALGAAAASAGLDVDRLLADMDSDRVWSELETSEAAAETLAIWGTPAITIGKTLVLGRQTSDQIDVLLEATPDAG